MTRVKFDHKVWGLVLAGTGVAVIAGYLVGVQQGEKQVAKRPADMEKRAAGMLSPGAQLPVNHPPIEGAASPAGGAATPMGDSKFTHFRVGNRNVKSLFVDGDVIWIGTSGGVIRYDTRDDSHQVYDNRVPGILSNGIFHVSRIGDHILAGTYGGGLSVFDLKSQEWKNYNIPQGLADQFVYDALKARNGDVWIATWSGANRIRGGNFDDPDKWDTYTVENTNGGLPNPWVYGVEEGADGELWFGTEDGLARFRDGKWRHWRHEDGLGAPYEAVRDAIQFTNDPARSSLHHAQQKREQGMQDVKVAYNPNYIISLQVDREGVVWCGTWGAGLARFDGKTWRNYTTADGLPSNHIFTLFLDTDGSLWAGTSQGLAHRNRDGSFTVLTTADGLFANNVFSMATASDRTLWVGSFGGVARLPRP